MPTGSSLPGPIVVGGVGGSGTRVIAHMDMAYSSNDQQLQNWGWLYNGTAPATESDLPEAALRYWIAANQAAVDQAQRLLGEWFMVLNYDALCESPQPVIEKLLDFLGWGEIAPEVRTRLYALPKMPESAGRYKDAKPLPFSKEQIAAVRAFGFRVDG